VTRAPRPIHGKTSSVTHDHKGVFRGIDSPLAAGRYHSLVIADEGLPGDLEVAARTEGDGIIMAVRHKTHPVHGVQFHPESVLTDAGRQLLRNFLDLAR
jgi:anthranilate synthase component 2